MRNLTSSALFLVTLGTAALALTGCAEDDSSTSSESNLIESKPKRFAPDQIGVEENWELWTQYCKGDREMTERPTPNYDNPEVMEAGVKLSQVASHSFSLYSDINSHHKTDVPAEVEGTVSSLSHQFLAYTCGEFRDRATMVQEKIRWVANMNYLNDEDTGAYDPAGNPWSQMKAADYHPYLRLSSSLWSAKQAKLSEEGRRYMQVGNITNIDTPVPGSSVCETKYMFAEYIKKGRTFDDLATFQAGYETFRGVSCTLPDDEDYFYDFRGDSNIKPNSPESNGMIWFARTMAKQCDSRQSAKPYSEARAESTVPNEACRRYFQYPFTSRWNAARAGLATWVLVDPNGGGLDSNSQYTVLPRYQGDENYMFGDKGPYRARNSSGEEVELLEGYKWSWGAMGLPELHANDKEKIHKLLQIAVDRHTDWYNSGYDDLMPYKGQKKDQAYSPFVASSYEMSESDNFVTPGTTVPVIDPDSRNYKHWMFVFRVHKDNLYTPERVNAEDVPIPNFDRMWFDETSFGESGLANSEKAWDRMGTSLEGEHEAALYLRNVPQYGY